MSRKFKEIFEEVKENANGSTLFNKGEYDKLALGMLNDPTYEVEVVSKRTDEGVETKTIKPSDTFRNEFVKPILKDFGVDKIEAEKINEYEFKNVKGLYEVQSEVNFAYLETGRKLNYLPKEDFEGGLILSNEKSSEKRHKKVKRDKDAPDEFFIVEKTAHRVIKAKSKTPKNKKKNREVE